LELHQPFPKAPFFANAVVEWEQLPGINVSVQMEGLSTYIAVVREVFDMPQDALGHFLDEFAFRHRSRWIPVILGRDLPVRPLATKWY